MKKLLIVLFICSCQRIELPENNNIIDSISSSQTYIEEFICKNDTAEFYKFGKYNIILSSISIPIITNYRLPTYNEAKLLQDYIIEDKRILCIRDSIYYTFNNSTITKAGLKTEYYYIPIRSNFIKDNIESNINIDTIWKENNILNP